MPANCVQLTACHIELRLMLHVAFVNHHPRWSRTNEALHWSFFLFWGVLTTAIPQPGRDKLLTGIGDDGKII